MSKFKSALLIPSSDGFDLFHKDGVDSHRKLMELANINPNDTKVNVAKLYLSPGCVYYDDVTDISKWLFVLEEETQPSWLDDSMLADAECELRQICSLYLTKDGKYTVLDDKGFSKSWHLNGKIHREEAPAIEFWNGNKVWYLNGRRHRDNGPAMEYTDGCKKWYINGKLHREDGPAVEGADGKGKAWWINGGLHREDGPALELSSGAKYWYINDKLHKEDGPAVVFSNGNKMWFINGKNLSEEEFNQR